MGAIKLRVLRLSLNSYRKLVLNQASYDLTPSGFAIAQSPIKKYFKIPSPEALKTNVQIVRFVAIVGNLTGKPGCNDSTQVFGPPINARQPTAFNQLNAHPSSVWCFEFSHYNRMQSLFLLELLALNAIYVHAASWLHTSIKKVFGVQARFSAPMKRSGLPNLCQANFGRYFATECNERGV